MEILGPLQIRIMHVIWRHKLTSVNDVHIKLNNEIDAPILAYTTILTVMRNLVKRQILHQEKSDGRSHTFTPLMTETEYKQSMINRICDDFFAGDKTKLKDALG